MSKRDNGGPAFGGAYDEVYVNQNDPEVTAKIERRVRGMSLRDYFAAAALQNVRVLVDGDHPNGWIGAQELHAKAAYAIADAMLAERCK